jgi:hypothetical protein
MAGGGAPSFSTLAPLSITSAQPSFGITAFDVQGEAADGSSFNQAGGHMDQLKTAVEFDTRIAPGSLFGPRWPVEPVGDAAVDAPPGLIANPNAVAKCTTAQLSGVLSKPLCPVDSQIGAVTVRYGGQFGFAFQRYPVFNMVPVPGEPARFGFNVGNSLIMLDAVVRSDSDYGVSVKSTKIPETVPFNGQTLTLWSDPSDPSHDTERACPGSEPPFYSGATCAAGVHGEPFLRLPTSCTGSLPYAIHADSWWNRGAEGALGLPDLSDPAWKSRSVVSHELPGYPRSPEDPSTPWGGVRTLTGCERVPVRGSLDARPTALEAETSSGLDVHIEVPNPGLENPTGISSSDIKSVTVKLPQGMTINPSQASGLGVCSEAQYESSRLEFHPDGRHGCPSDSKIGSVAATTPLLDETLPGDVYVAKPYDNPFDSFLALYIVIEEPERGIIVKQPLELRLNETTGRIEAEVRDIPQVPFSTFDFHFREGARAPLATPPVCGTYTTKTQIEGYSHPGEPIESDSTFQITKGIGGAPCPPGGTPGFTPGFSAGSINNNAGAYSPFNMRITRNDGEQDMTRFSAVLPPGVLGKLAGVGKCPDAAIALAKSKSGVQEQQSPSCPASSEIGHSTVGAGVGSVLTYIPGKVYLGGPFHGDPLSVIAITPAVAGPFDVGTVVVHEALTLNPVTAEVEVDGSASDPIPHILKGIPAKLRDLRVYVDKPKFTLNPTACDPSSARATLFGGGGNPFSTLDDVPVSLSDRYQAAGCAALGLKPRLKIHLAAKRSTRGAFPRLRAEYLPRGGDANVSRVSALLPSSELLENAHFRTICTRVQFDAGAGMGAQCPPGSVYGAVKAWTPLLDDPLQGSVYLRSSNHELPDMVLVLHGIVDIEAVARIDSAHGRIRSTFEGLPDAPLSRVVLNLQGGKKSLLVNSTDICRRQHRAKIRVTGQNGKLSDLKPRVTANCKGGA